MRCLLLAPLLAIAACSDSTPATTPDAPPPSPDAPPANPATCLISSDFGDLGTLTGTTTQGPTTLTVTIDAGPPRDAFFLKLNAGKGVFAGGLANGTYPLTGAELDSTTCGLCVNILADIVAMQGSSKFFFATGGTVTLTSTSPPAGTLQDVTFHEVTVGGQPVAGGCTTKIAAMAFSVP